MVVRIRSLRLSALTLVDLRFLLSNLGRILACMVACLLLPMAEAQILASTNATAAPIPGAGHDYIHLLNETVNPANGSVSLSINFPMPKGRGLTMPFSITYSSGQVIVSDPTIMSAKQDDPDVIVNYASLLWYNNIDLLSTGGWTYGLPFANWSTGKTSAQGAYTDPNGNAQYCPNATGYTFRDPSGGAHTLGLGAVGSTSNAFGAEQCQTIASTQGGDDLFAASITYRPSSLTNLNTPLTVSDLATGTTYKFAGYTLYGGGSSDTGLLPNLIEDRNGNQINVTQSLFPSPVFDSKVLSFTFTDTLKRAVLSDTGFTNSPEIITAAGQSYSLQWTTTSANYTLPATGNLSQLGGNCGGVGSVTFPSPNYDFPLTVLSSITLPNGQAYHFYYGDNNPHGVTNPFGLLSEIDYPDGGSVQYTWKFSDQYSDSVYYPSGGEGLSPPGGSTNLAGTIPDGCQYHYKAPVVATRTVFYAGTSPATIQTFSYATNWDFSTPTAWKTTQVTTTDVVRNKSALTQYTYQAIRGSLPPYSKSNIAPLLPVEQTVTTYDWGNTSTPLAVETKAWYDQYQMACDFTTLASGFSSGHFYQYGPGVQVSDDKEYDFGQITTPNSVCTGVGTNASLGPIPAAPQSPTPARETTTAYQSFTSSLGAVFSSAQSTVISGSGTPVAETDYAYDAGSLSPAAAVQHDETNYPASAVANRANLTSVTRKCLSGCLTDSITSSTYDETGQMVSSLDGCGNPACADMTGISHTTTYSYTDKPSGGNSAGNSNAYLTQITDPLGHTQSFGYNYTTGELGSRTDANGQTTVYTYADPLNRLTLTSFPDGGSTSLVYNDSVPSVTTTSAASPNPSITGVSIMDGMGHVTQTQLTSDPSGTVYVDTTYDGEGMVYTRSNPYRSSSDPTNGTTTLSYNALGGKIQQTNPDSSSQQWCYNGVGQGCSFNASSFTNDAWSDFTDELGNHWQHVSDGLGRLVAVMEPSGTSSTPTLETDYTYNGLNNLLSSVQHGAKGGTPRSRSFTYDSFSRLLTALNPETGTICYGLFTGGSCQGVYDQNGNLSFKTDAKGIITSYSYDVLNRLLSKSFSGSSASTLSSCYQYDSSNSSLPTANLIGRLTYAWTQKGSCTSTPVTTSAITETSVLAYDALGRMQQSQKCVLGTCQSGIPLSLTQGYDLAGNMTMWTDGMGINIFGQVFDGAGRPLSVTSSWTDPLHPATLFSGATYSPAGALTGATYGTALQLTRSFDSRLRPATENVVGNLGSKNGIAAAGVIVVTGQVQSK